MATKYAAARDVAYQWRAECRKLKRENKSLRMVYEAARDLHSVLATSTPPPQVCEAAGVLKDALRNAVFAVEK